MDVDPGVSVFRLFISLLFISFSERPSPLLPIGLYESSDCNHSVCIPYSLVPGMDVSSTAYSKAISILSKQPDHALALCTAAGPPVPPVRMDIGLFLFLFPYYATNLSFLDDPNGGFSAIDRDAIKRARDILADTTMSEIIDEDSKAQESFNDSLRHQIVITCQRLHVHLHLIDRLMVLYNQAAASKSNV